MRVHEAESMNIRAQVRRPTVCEADDVDCGTSRPSLTVRSAPDESGPPIRPPTRPIHYALPCPVYKCRRTRLSRRDRTQPPTDKRWRSYGWHTLCGLPVATGSSFRPSKLLSTLRGRAFRGLAQLGVDPGELRESWPPENMWDGSGLEYVLTP